ncbi:hypothetical protein SASPL_140776 [Salvia splendens]|uniref:Uncharacterized protein n=1 Tax=Salvia splendens TaxID=180675 RepID=A0A8X8WPE1_SALSN|nr:hypothetical protein SASPL_140776 [Salvia splendens]
MEPPLSSRLPEVSAVAYSRLLSPSRKEASPPSLSQPRPVAASRRLGYCRNRASSETRHCYLICDVLLEGSSYVVLGFLVIELDYSSVYAKASWKNLVSYGVVEFTSTAVFRFLSLLRLSLPLACSSAIE